MFSSKSLFLSFVLISIMPLTPMAARAAEPVPQSSAEESEGAEYCKINTPDVSVVDPGKAEFEIVYNYSRATRAWDNNSNGIERGFTREHSASMALTVGLLKNLDANISAPYRWIKDKDNDFDADDDVDGPFKGNGFGDLSFSGRYRFFESESLGMESGYVGGFTAPTGGRARLAEMGTSQEFWSWDQKLIAVKNWGKWTANMDAGFSLPFGSHKGNARGTFNADLAGGYQLREWIIPEIELNYSHDFIANEDNAESLAVTTGFVMPVHDLLSVNMGFQQAVWGRNSDKSTTFILSAKTFF